MYPGSPLAIVIINGGNTLAITTSETICYAILPSVAYRWRFPVRSIVPMDDGHYVLRCSPARPPVRSHLWPRIHEHIFFLSFERINSIRVASGNFDSCISCKRLVPSRLHELHESKFAFVTRIKFIRSKLSNFYAHVSGVTDGALPRISISQ